MSYVRNLFAVTAASFIGFMGFTLVMPFLPLYFRQLGVTETGRIAMWSGLSLALILIGIVLLFAWRRKVRRLIATGDKPIDRT